ncbi:MAG TPA: ATP-dependent endonuclease [Cytophagales bacterium]|jgi:ATP-dependent exoDNAse (exonuclease V) alpha subunit|nr:ATP-dependent endonuclease [Cytophagales bacterium]
MPKISNILRQKFPYEPTEGQARLFNMLDSYVEEKEKKKCLVIKGYAGTGKTSLISTLVNVFPLFNLKYILMAPTGRAAKVMSNYAGRPAYTIHKKMYKQVADPASGELQFKKVKNYHTKTVFIVDEASMLSDKAEFGKNSLIADLIHYVFENEDNRLILVGDLAQLPPVGAMESPALDENYLKDLFRLKVWAIELKDVVRQEAGSGILINATNLRNSLSVKNPTIQFKTKKFRDIYRMNADKLEDGLQYAYQKFGVENTTIVCRSNWQAVQYNQLIRRTIMYYDEELEAGDILMVVRNNYQTIDTDSEAGFIANGDFVEVRKIIDFEDRYGFRFATLRLQMIDYPDMEPFDAKIILDTLYTKTPALSNEQNRSLYQQVMESYNDINTRKALKEALQTDEYLNALQVKFAYALTCHKSQGGQWKIVFVDQSLWGDMQLGHEYIRWLYTAVTRATEELYLLNFKQEFFE